MLALCGCPYILYRWIVLQIPLRVLTLEIRDYPASDPSESVRSKIHAPAKPNEALLRISQGVTRELERLTAPKAPINMVRRQFHGTNMEESDKAEF